MLAKIYFNSHPHEEDDVPSRLCWPGKLYFNSHPHEEDDCILGRHYIQATISTHILTKRMTGPKGLMPNPKAISTHILTKRMTYICCYMSITILFQLTSSRRGWPRKSTEKYSNQLFQLTSSRRGWLITQGDVYEPSAFQLTSSRRGWRSRTVFVWMLWRISTHILTKRMTYST